MNIFREDKKKEEDKGWRHELDEPLKSSPNDFDTFLNSTIWHDMRMAITDRIEILTDALVNKAQPEDVKDLQAEIRTLNDMLALPEYLQYRIKIEEDRTHAED